MHSQFVIAALAATASASANLFPGHIAIRRDLLIARQTESTAAPTATSGGLSDSECQVSLLAIATELPIPDGDLLDWEQSQAGTDPCSITSIPASLSSQYTSYTDAVLSWYSESSSELYEAISACPQYAGAVSEVQVCTDLTMASGSTGSTSVIVVTQSDNNGASATGSAATGSSTGTASGSASSSAETTAGAPLREAGIVGAVLAGVLGVAVAL
ncbi:hypothetical protein F5883DRAFT_579035 [Diaporthe sp. PMI_573]|nr:hypothetical protein F5883DRAFT_579035 [Diaporthaceae sp. PMI_573]